MASLKTTLTALAVALPLALTAMTADAAVSDQIPLETESLLENPIEKAATDNTVSNDEFAATQVAWVPYCVYEYVWTPFGYQYRYICY